VPLIISIELKAATEKGIIHMVLTNCLLHMLKEQFLCVKETEPSKMYLTTHLKFSKIQKQCTRPDKLSFYKALPLTVTILFTTTYDRWHFDIFTAVIPRV